MTTEEKAKAYDEVIKKAESLYKVSEPMSGCNVIIETLFPELKESEDERIRKRIIALVNAHGQGMYKDEMLAWLEKQGVHANFRNKIQIGDKVTRNQDGMLVNLSQLKRVAKPAEQKPADKVEPKLFHEGDWVVSPNGVYWHIDAIQNGRYEVTANTGQCGNWPLDTNLYHLWTIKDAKDGDVLYECNEKKPFIFKELKTKHIGDIASYCDIFNDIFNPNEDDWTTLDIVPATKEQRNLLFEKIKEAGYVWDAERKELKKIEHKRICELDNSYTYVKFPFKAKVKSSDTIVTIYSGQLSLNGKEWIKYQSDTEDGYKIYEPNNLELVCEIEQKLTWNEEDEEIIEKCIESVRHSCYSYSTKIKAENFLKSLISQATWKPSDRQMRALKEVCDEHWELDGLDPLYTLYQDLKKLK